MSGSVLLPDCCRTLGKDHALAAAGGQLATRPNHTFQFLPQLLNAVSPVVVLEEISVLQVCDLAQHPKIELLPVKANDLGSDLVEATIWIPFPRKGFCGAGTWENFVVECEKRWATIQADCTAGHVGSRVLIRRSIVVRHYGYLRDSLR